ncbi:cytochrome d ubiquinol oxidase subunit II [Peribacillus simplex]|uniref:Cytochrome d ubiquinol oxidase subunit II n=1 Tax=Peribacillus simplex TaxID=1478 RepID=A0A9X8ZEG3_9BACI|nr:cytochrome d ubiquinol oxidase subunit II [Peribacillus simplex]TKH08508.1 cytochrome d ubiquinol oxidase subunit II [Peribacillus simplex]
MWMWIMLYGLLATPVLLIIAVVFALKKNGKAKKMFMISGASFALGILGVFISAEPVPEPEPVESNTDELFDIEKPEPIEEPTVAPAEEEEPYTEEELESDPQAPSENPADYNSDGEYVPEDGPTDNPADYNSDGEYKPADDMTQEEIEQELEDMLNGQ